MTNRQRFPKILALVVYSVAVVAVFATMYTVLAGGRVPGVSSEQYKVSVLVDEPLQLVTGSDVRRAGVKIGRVDDIRVKGQRALVTMDLKPEHQSVYRDARVETRLRTLLGESYLEVDPGTPTSGRIEDGGLLPPDAARETVPLDKILNTLDDDTRASLQSTLRAFGRGLDDRGDDVNSILSGLTEAVDLGLPATVALREQRDSVVTLVDDGARVLNAVGRRGDALRTLIRATNQTATAVASRDDALRRTIQEFPRALPQVRRTLAAVSGLSRKATPVTDDLGTAAVALTPVLRDLPATAADARKLVARLPAALRATDPFLKELKPAAQKAAPVADTLGPLLRNLVPMLEFLEPYKRDIWGVGAGMGSVFAFEGEGEQPGHSGPHAKVASGRVQLLVSNASLGATPPSLAKLEDALLQTGVLKALGGLKTNYTPPPGSADNPPRRDGNYPVVSAIPDE